MMRLTMAVWWSLALIWLVAGSAGADSPDDEAMVRREVKGYGPTLNAAKRNALREAVVELEQYLRTRRPPLVHWQPTEAFVGQHLIDGAGREGAEVQLEEFGPAKTWIVHLKIPAETTLVDWDRRAERTALAEQRLGQTLHAVLAIGLIIALGIGYIRLDDWTRSRYTAWLRLAGFGLTAVVVAGWWWTQ